MEQNNFKNKILEKIEAGDVSMKPRAYFMISMVAVILLAVLILVTTILLISYTLFSVVVSGHMLLLGFGWRGVLAFMTLFPWLYFCIDIVLLFILDSLIRTFKFGYHRPVLLLFAGTTVVLVVLGYIVSVTSLHGQLLHRAEERRLPPIAGPIGPLYDHLRASHRDHGVIQGTVTSIMGNTFTIGHDDYDPDMDEATTTIVAPPGTTVNDFLKIGDHVLVAGDILPTGELQAYGVTKFQIQQ